MTIINRETFAKSIKQDLVKNLLSDYFDENMALYNLIGDNGSDINTIAMITTDKDMSHSRGIAFSVATNSKESAKKLKNVIDTHETSCYQNQYDVSATIKKDYVLIELHNKVSD